MAASSNPVISPNGKRVLIVDDEKDLSDILKFKLQSFGFQVITAYDGKEGFEKILSEQPHCVVLDIRMPHEDGLTMLRKIRSYRADDPEVQSRVRKIPIVVMTGAGENMKSLFEMESISDYLEKPYDIEKLKQKLLKLSA